MKWVDDDGFWDRVSNVSWIVAILVIAVLIAVLH